MVGCEIRTDRFSGKFEMPEKLAPFNQT
ncbi:MAG: hypothetical protein RL215_627, partial [Planctomycetota bacterium]